MAQAAQLDTAQKIKIGLAITAIVASLALLAYHFGLFGGDKPPVSVPTGAHEADTAIPDELVEESKAIAEERAEEMEEEGIIESGG